MEEDAEVDEDVAKVLKGTDGDPEKIRERVSWAGGVLSACMSEVIMHHHHRNLCVSCLLLGHQHGWMHSQRTFLLTGPVPPHPSHKVSPTLVHHAYSGGDESECKLPF